MAIILKGEATTLWCSHCSDITRTKWEGDSRCCLDCGKILGQVFQGKFIKEGKRRTLSRTGCRRQRRRRAAAMAVEEQQMIVPTFSETDSS